MKGWPIIVCVAFVLAGCASLLPSGEDRIDSRWHSFEAAKRDFDRIEPFKTTAPELTKLGYDPSSNPNVKILTYTDIIRRLVPDSTIKEEDLDLGLRDCVEKQDGCLAYELDYQQLDRKRYGNFWLDFFNFKRRVEITGWRFDAVVLLKDGVVVYKLWGGQPDVHKFESRHNPLGPLQGIGEGLKP